MKVKIVFNKDYPFGEKEEIFDDVVEVHYCYPSFIKGPQTAIEQKTTGQTFFNKYIKELEIKEDEVKEEIIKDETWRKKLFEDLQRKGFIDPKVIWAIDLEGYPPFPKEEIWFLKEKDLLHAFGYDKIFSWEEVFADLRKRGLHPSALVFDEAIENNNKDFDILYKKYKDEIFIDTFGCIHFERKEAHMKKAAFYLEPTTLRGEEGYIIRNWENVLKERELPVEYFDGFPFFYLDDGGDVKVRGKLINPLTPYTYYLIKNDFIDERVWEKIHKLLIESGHRLSEILKEQRKPIRVEI